ncbi:rhodanese-like domain-containing protein [Ferrovibrio sp.]|uniref:rhodanese-like domain-containing protein n=1 Tax=Ferrovibrio sp. TaxID=1917215 RepID=UPI0025C13420|nr:rhodanese-like domain-containing protein [Ferrovibrio sp.]MBX3456192.1 rhodanese-like domain-containing protein [Ferrovibrio sp.]
MPIGYKQMVAEALSEIETMTPEQVAKHLGNPDTQLVDIRDPRELERDGAIPGALHATRGMLEFWIDPESPYHRKAFAEPKQFIFFCAGGLRSSLAGQTAKRMGIARVAHMDGGFGAWKKAGLPVEEWAPKAPAGDKK